MKYNIYLRILHWVMALLVLTMIFLGWFMEYLEDIIGKTNPKRLFLYDLHKSLGIIVLILMIIRIITRLVTYIPPLPLTIHPGLRITSRISHYAMYLLMLAIPLLRYAMSDSFGKGVQLFGLPLPKPLPDNKLLGKKLAELHGFFAYTLLVLVIVHIAGVIWHRFFDKRVNNILSRMV